MCDLDSVVIVIMYHFSRKYEKEQREAFAQLRNKAHKERGLLFRYNIYDTTVRAHTHTQHITLWLS